MATGDLDANQTVETPVYDSGFQGGSTPPPRSPSHAGTGTNPPRSGSFDALSLRGLVDSENDFDVDSVVNAIVNASSEADTNPGARMPASGIRKVTPLPRSPSFPGAFPPFDEEESFPSEPPTRHGLVDVPPAPSGNHSPWSPQPEVERMAWGARVRVDAGAPLGPSSGTDSLDLNLPDGDGSDERSEAVELRPGDVIQDRYRVIDELGRGGMSIVYRAEHTLLLKDVAMKLLRPELSMLKNVVERFQREARSVCRLDDPNIVRVTDFGRTKDGLLYLVMDLIDGRSLASLLDAEGRMTPDQAIPLVDQILSGLEHAHRFEIVHRDLKPENIMLVERDDQRLVKILDFGIAKLGNADQKSITQAGTVFGTPRYMSPEQAAGEPVDHRTDLYTVGVILYQLLTGRVPFEGDSTVQLLAKVLTQDPPPLQVQGARESTRQALEQVVFQALAKEPEDRFASARAFRRALEACRD